MRERGRNRFVQREAPGAGKNDVSVRTLAPRKMHRGKFSWTQPRSMWAGPSAAGIDMACRGNWEKTRGKGRDVGKVI